MIAVEVSYTDSDYVRVIRLMVERQTKIFMIMLVLGAIIMTLLLYRSNPEGFHWWALPAIAGLVFFLFYFARFMQRFNIGRQLKGVPGIKEPYVFTFNEEGIAIAGRLSSTNIKWEAIVKACESSTDFLFYTTKRFAQFLPKRAFGHNEEMNELRVLLSQRLGDKARLLA
jgi:hypothetical protein